MNAMKMAVLFMAVWATVVRAVRRTASLQNVSLDGRGAIQQSTSALEDAHVQELEAQVAALKKELIKSKLQEHELQADLLKKELASLEDGSEDGAEDSADEDAEDADVDEDTAEEDATDTDESFVDAMEDGLPNEEEASLLEEEASDEEEEDEEGEGGEEEEDEEDKFSDEDSEGGHVSSLAELQGKKCPKPPGGRACAPGKITHQFSKMDVRELLCFQRTTVGKKWPRSCKTKGDQDAWTDGFLCDMKKGCVPDATIYGGVLDSASKSHGRCHRKKCVSSCPKGQKCKIKKMTEIGAVLTTIALRTAGKVKVKTSTGQTHEVGISVIEGLGSSPADIGVKLVIPSKAVRFNGYKPKDGSKAELAKAFKKATTFREAATSRETIEKTLNMIGAFSIPSAIKVCAHGFTDAPRKGRDGHKTKYEDLEDMILGRATVVGEVAKEVIGGMGVTTTFEKVAHLKHANSAAGGLIIKLNGAAATGCSTGDWKGDPI